MYWTNRGIVDQKSLTCQRKGDRASGGGIENAPAEWNKLIAEE